MIESLILVPCSTAPVARVNVYQQTLPSLADASYPEGVCACVFDGRSLQVMYYDVEKQSVLMPAVHSAEVDRSG